jgi:hypothetical protein
MQLRNFLDCTRPHATVVSLRGASELTSSFLKFAVNSILYNRQIFPKQSFASAQRLGCEVHVTKDEWLEKYLTKFFGQVHIRRCIVMRTHMRDTNN